MSIQSRQSEVARLTSSIAKLRAQDATEAGKEAAKAKELNRARQAIISRNMNQNMVRFHEQKALRCSSELARILKRRAGLGTRIASEISRLHSAQQALRREFESERKKVETTEKRRSREQLEHARSLKREEKATLLESRLPMNPGRSKVHDAFISHASEDKEGFVRPLAEALRSEGFDIWFDEFALSVGDSLRRTIDNGLVASRFGIVVLSSNFFRKNWPQYELDGLVAKEMEGQKVILPIWHMVSRDQVMEYSPSLADKVAINSSLSTTAEIVSQLSDVLRNEKRLTD